MREVKNVPVENEIIVIEMFDTFIPPKKHSQWIPTMAPTPAIRQNNLGDRSIFLRAKSINTKRLITTMSSRHQTKETESKEISFPNMAVKPQQNTQRCRRAKAWFLVMSQR